jgi:iron complex outermembrane receptor protein
VNLGPVTGGVYAYGEVEDSHSFYKGHLSASPDRRDLGRLRPGQRLEHGLRRHEVPLGRRRADARLEPPDPEPDRQRDLHHRPRHHPGRQRRQRPDDPERDQRQQRQPYYYDPAFNPLYIPYYGFYNTNAAHTLDTGVGTTKLSPRTVYISPADFSKTDTNTLYFDLAKDLSPDSNDQGAVLLRRPGEQALRLVRLSGLVRQLGLGRPGHLQLRQRPFGDGGEAKSFVGVSYRDFSGRRRESYNSGVIALDRRDISFGATATDIIDSPFTTETGRRAGLAWENDNKSDWSRRACSSPPT